MKKVSLVIMLCLATYGVVFSQTGEKRKSVFQLSFISPLSTNGLHSYRYTNQVSFNMFAGVSENEEVFTLGGLSNLVLKDAKGFQLAGLLNYVGNRGTGFQFAGLANLNRGSFTGFQFAGLVNYAKDVRGVQLAALVNIAENSDCPIGLVNLIKNGEKGLAVTYDAIGNAVVSFRSGGKYTYGIVGVGYNHKAHDHVLVTEAGVGVHIPCTSWFRINQELKASSIGCDADEPVFNGGYSLLPAFKIGKHLELFGGAGIQYATTSNLGNANLFSTASLWEKRTTTRLQRIYIGYQFGVQYIF